MHGHSTPGENATPPDKTPFSALGSSAWLTRCTQRPQWQTDAETAAPEKMPTGDQPAGKQSMNRSIVYYEASECDAFSALEIHAHAMGRTLTRTSRGYFLQRGQSSLHVSDVHSVKEILKLMQSTSGGSP